MKAPKALVCSIGILTLLLAAPGTAKPSYDAYGKLLSRHVCRGGVAYSEMKNDTLITLARAEFASVGQRAYESMSSDEKLAYLINLYNFYTLDLILDNYPVKSIRDISRPWAQKFVPFRGKEVSLDHVEHEIIRKEFNEPRIHFVLVCAAISCPALASEPFRAVTLDEQLTTEAQRFLTNDEKNRVDKRTLHLSKIFDWYGQDFQETHDGYVEYIKKTLGLEGKYRVKFLDYDWSLNEVDECP